MTINVMFLSFLYSENTLGNRMRDTENRRQTHEPELSGHYWQEPAGMEPWQFCGFILGTSICCGVTRGRS